MYSEIIGVGDDAERPGIMHRLDKDTTGVMVVAKNQRTFNALKKGFQEKTIQKTYHALVFGEVDDEGVIDAPIARATSYTKQKIAFGKYAGEAKEAQTAYKKIATYRVNEEISISLIEARPKTGRMHQIRVHMAHIGHPLVGDQRYYTKIERKLPLDILKAYDMHTFFLHAKELQFALNGVEHVYNVEYPDRFKALLRFLEEFRV
jgi:RluA family pseudouridine synthase